MPGAIGQLDLFWFTVLIVSCVAFYMAFLNCIKVCVFSCKSGGLALSHTD